MSFFGVSLSSSAGNTSGGLVSVGLESSTEAFSDELPKELGVDFSTACVVTIVSLTVDVASSDDEVDKIASDFCSSVSGISAADKSAANRKFRILSAIVLYCIYCIYIFFSYLDFIAFLIKKTVKRNCTPSECDRKFKIPIRGKCSQWVRKYLNLSFVFLLLNYSHFVEDFHNCVHSLSAPYFEKSYNTITSLVPVSRKSPFKKL